MGESAAIISSDEIPERRRRRRCHGGGIPTRARSVSQFRLADSFATMCNSFERGRHVEYVSTSRRILRTRAAYASRRRDRQRSRSKVITPGCVLTIATRTSTMAVAVARKGEGRTLGPAGRLVANPRREGDVVHCPTIELYERPAGRRDRPAMLFPNSNSSSRVSERKVNHHLAAAASGVMSPRLILLGLSVEKKFASSRRDKQVSIRGRDTRCSTKSYRGRVMAARLSRSGNIGDARSGSSG